MKGKLTLVGLGIAGGLGIFLLAERSSLVSTHFRAPQPVARFAASSPDPGEQRSAEPVAETPVVPHPDRPRASREDTQVGNALRAQILAAMESSDPNSQEMIFSLLAQWTQQDPAGAGRFAKSLPSGRWRQTMIHRVAQDWAVLDLASAERWASRLPDQSERDSTVADVCFQVAQTDARQAMQMAEQHGLEAAPGAILENIAQQWAAQDLPAATSWIMAQPAGALRDQMLGRLAYVQSQTEPAAAANLVVEQITGGPIQDEAAMSVLHQWALRDMTAAAAWVNQFPPGALHDRAQAELQGLAAYSH